MTIPLTVLWFLLHFLFLPAQGWHLSRKTTPPTASFRTARSTVMMRTRLTRISRLFLDVPPQTALHESSSSSTPSSVVSEKTKSIFRRTVCWRSAVVVVVLVLVIRYIGMDIRNNVRKRAMMSPVVHAQQSISLPAPARTVHLAIAVGIVLAVVVSILGRFITGTMWRRTKTEISGEANNIDTSEAGETMDKDDVDELDEVFPPKDLVSQSKMPANANSTTAFINSNKARVQEQMVKRILEQYTQENNGEHPPPSKEPSLEEHIVAVPLREPVDRNISTMRTGSVELSNDVIREEILPESSRMRSTIETLEMSSLDTEYVMESQADRFQRAISSERSEVPTNTVGMDDSSNISRDEESMPQRAARHKYHGTVTPNDKTQRALLSARLKMEQKQRQSTTTSGHEVPTNTFVMHDSANISCDGASEFQSENKRKHPGLVPPSDATQRALLSTRLKMEQQQRQSTTTTRQTPLTDVKEMHQRCILVKRIELEALVKARECATRNERLHRALLSMRLEMEKQHQSAQENLDEKYASIENVSERAYTILKDLGML